MTLPTLPMTDLTAQAGGRAATLLALLAGLASTSGCQLLYDSKLADSQRDCEKRVMQTDVTDCRRSLQAQQDAFRRRQDDKAKAGRAAPAASR